MVADELVATTTPNIRVWRVWRQQLWLELPNLADNFDIVAVCCG
jgi:hypothetical protein